MHYCSHFADENNKAERDSETCSRSPRCRPASVWGADGALRVGVWAQEPPSLVVLRASCSMHSVSFLHDWSTLVPGVGVCVRAIRIAPNVISVTENSHLFIPRVTESEPERSLGNKGLASAPLQVGMGLGWVPWTEPGALPFLLHQVVRSLGWGQDLRCSLWSCPFSALFLSITALAGSMCSLGSFIHCLSPNSQASP